MNAKTAIQNTATALSYQTSPAGHVVTVSMLGAAFAGLDTWALGLAKIPAPPEFVLMTIGAVAATLVIRWLAL